MSPSQKPSTGSPMLNERPAWQALAKHRTAMDKIHMRDLFSRDKARFRRFSLKHEGLLIDYSKHRITDETIGLLFDLARDSGVNEARDAMFAGEKINFTEQRAVLHTALRRPPEDQKKVCVDGENVMPFIRGELEKMGLIAEQIRSGAWTGYSGKAVNTVINMGIGGSDLGPLMVCEALKNIASKKVSVRFVSNIDPAHLTETLKDCDPETTLFVIASKSFTTQETRANAQAARKWLLDKAGDENAIRHHFIALSTNESAVKAFGIDPAHMLSFREWVGGRYSLWSVIGLPVAIAIGMNNFRELLNGAFVMDRHFREAPLTGNMPVIMALLGIWYRNFWEADSYAVLPYAQNLHRFPAYLQQLDMESNGKSITKGGYPVPYRTGPAIFGEPGTNAQHAFMQHIHQGTDLIPCDFIGVIECAYGDQARHECLLANMLAQGQALMQGRTYEESGNDPHRTFPGNNPSTAILLQRLDPYHLGMLIALYEHKIFVQGAIWDINSFDQWGVELGKTLSKNILGALEKEQGENLDSSTEGLLAHVKQARMQNKD